MKNTKILRLSLCILLERGCYYGIRSILFIHFTDFTARGTLDQQANTYYIGLLGLATFLVLPFGWLSDRFIGQHKAGLLGGILMMTGSLFWLFDQSFTFMLTGLFLFVIGSSWLRPNAMAAVGRLFQIKDRQRTTAYMAYNIAINIGVFLGILVIGTLAEGMNKVLTFGSVLLAMTTATLLYSQSHKNYTPAGTAINEDELEHTLYQNDTLLDEPPTTTRHTKGYNKTLLVALLIFLSICFWKLYSYCNYPILDGIEYYLRVDGNLTLFGAVVPVSIVPGLGSYIAIFMSIFTFLVWLKVGKKISNWMSIAAAFVLMSIGSFIVHLTLPYDEAPSTLLEIYLLPLLIIGLAEALITPILFSLVTRISSPKYTATVFGFFILATELGGRLLQIPLNRLEEIFLPLAVGGIALVIGVALLSFRKQLIRKAGGID